MYDLHCHILPGVDDGSSSFEESVAMARMAEKNGIKAIFATPHYIEDVWNKDVLYNQMILDKLNLELRNNDINVKIYLGNEVYSTFNVLNLLESEEITTLNNSSYILIELPMHEVPIYVESMIYSLKLAGITPIIAHPERNTRIIDDPNILYSLISKGALGQLNLSSLLGLYGRRVKKTAKVIVKHNMIHFVGTDSHKPMESNYKINKTTRILNKLIGSEKTLKLTSCNPEKIAEGINIVVEEPKKVNGTRHLTF